MTRPASTLIFFTLPLLIPFFAGCSPGRGQVSLLNKTGREIKEGRLKVGSQDFVFSRVKSGDSRQFSFECGECGPCRYQVGITLSDHRQAVETIGFIQRGMDYQDTLEIDGKNLILDSAASPSGNANSLSKGSQSQKLKWILSK
jgi:hypothetical protein